jgi:hypothetical protein
MCILITYLKLTCVVETHYAIYPVSSKTVSKVLVVSCIFQNTGVLESCRLRSAQTTVPAATVRMLISTLIESSAEKHGMIYRHDHVSTCDEKMGDPRARSSDRV